MPKYTFSLIFVCCFLLSAVARADSDDGASHDYLVHVWQTDKGLPQNWVSSIAQTPDGYLWVGTRYGGVARFDGVRFVPYNLQDTRELKDVQVEHLSVDNEGRLWIVMGNESLTSFQNGQFRLQRLPRSAPRLRLDSVLCVHSNIVLFTGEYPYLATDDLSSETNSWRIFDPRPNMEPDPMTFSLDSDGNVWFVTAAKRLGCFSNGHFKFVPDGFPERTVAALATDTQKQLWIATPRHFGKWDGKHFLDCTPTNGPAPAGILQISCGGDGGLWVLENNRIRKFLHGRWVAEIDSGALFKSITASTFSLHADRQGNAWVVANGIGLLHCKSDSTAHLLTEKSGLPGRFITCWFQDAAGDIWIGLHGGGIALVRERLFHAYGENDGLPDKVVSSVCVDQSGRLWAGTMSGDVAYLEHDKFITVPLPSPPGDPNESITVLPASNGGVWIGTINHGLMEMYDHKIFPLNQPPENIRVLFIDSQKQLWIGELAGLVSGTLKRYGEADGFVSRQAVESIGEDRAGAIWIGTGPGDLWRLLDHKFTRYTPPPEWPSVRFSSVLPDANGVVWVGTLGGGLLRFQNGHFSRWLKKDGLPDNNIPQLLDSHDGYLWGGTYAGIFRVKKTDLEAVANGTETRLPCQVYGVFDGLPALECSSGFQPSCWRSHDGRLWFSTANGVASIDPLNTVINPLAPTVIIEEMQVDGDWFEIAPHRGAALSGTGQAPRLKIPPGRHYLQFRFTGLNYAAPDGVRFQVKLDGGDGKWHAIGGQRLIGYGPLLPGRYRFHVIACNNDGVWNEAGDTLAFTVLPYFWETWWFKISMGLLMLAGLGAGASLLQRQRYRRKLELAERQREMAHERTRIARDLHDDLGTSLTQISMLSAMANREKTSAGEAKELIQQVRSRAREMVVSLDEIVWAVNPKNDSVPGLISYLSHFAEEFYRPANIPFRLEIPPSLPDLPFSAQSRHHLFLAFKEAVNNTARHSRATKVEVRVEMLEDELSLCVEDNGNGFDPNANDGSETGNGLINMKRRLEQIGGRAEIRSVPGAGTTITFCVPLKNSSHS